MKSSILLLFYLTVFAFVSCKDGDDDDVITYEYHAHIMEPSSAGKTLGDILVIHVEFESHTGEDVEHINVRIFNKATNVVVYDKPSDAHVGNGSASYDFEDQVTLSAANGFSAGDWNLQAKVWGAEHEQDLETETVEFHIHP